MYEAHGEDMDKGGYPYVFHPFFLPSRWRMSRLPVSLCCMT